MVRLLWLAGKLGGVSGGGWVACRGDVGFVSICLVLFDGRYSGSGVSCTAELQWGLCDL